MSVERERKKPNWETIREFEKDGIVVRLQSAGRLYSMQIGRRPPDSTDGRLIPFLPIRLKGTKSLTESLRLECNLAREIGELVTTAQEYVLENEEYHRARNLHYLVERDELEVEKGKPRTRHTGKTARNREKRKKRAE